jgi:cell division topological specificity factor
MFEGIISFFKKFAKSEEKNTNSKDTAKERLHLVLMQDRANVSADFLEMMKQEIIEVIKKYIEVDEKEIDVKLTNKTNEDGSIGAPALYANIPITNIKNENKNTKISDEVKKSEKKAVVEKQDSNKNDTKIKENKDNAKSNETKKDEIKENNINKQESKEKEEAKQDAEIKKEKEPKQVASTKKSNKSTKPISSKKKKK